MLKSLGWMSTEYLEGFCVIYGIFGGDCGTSVLSGLPGPGPWGLCSSLHDSVWGICPIAFLGPRQFSASLELQASGEYQQLPLVKREGFG